MAEGRLRWDVVAEVEYASGRKRGETNGWTWTVRIVGRAVATAAVEKRNMAVICFIF